MAITYNYNRCKGGFGVYVRALSGADLNHFIHKLPELEGITITGGIPIRSGRITRKQSEKQAKQFIARLKSEPITRQYEILDRLFMSPTDKVKVAVKLQYFRIKANFLGQDYNTLFTSQDRERVEHLAMQYADMDTPIKITPTVARTIVLTPELIQDVVNAGLVTPAIPKGIKGMQKPIKDQTSEFIQRIAQRRKKTTTNSFFNRYR